jgi:long-chain acyl-CoA synthetase
MEYNLYSDIKETAKLRNSHIALIDGKKKISYADLIKSADIAASELKDVGLTDYAKTVLIGADTSEYLTAALAILANRGVFVSAGKEINNSEFNELLEKIGIKFALLETTFTKHLKAENYNECTTMTVGSREFKVFKRCRETKPENSDFKKLNPAFIRFSSGTTGDSKGIILSHETINARTKAANHALKITEDDHVLWLLPMAYHFAVTIMLFLQKGCTIDISVDNKQESIVKKLISGKVTFVYATPYHYANMIRTANELQKSKKLNEIAVPDSVRLLISTAMPLTEEIFANFAKRFGRYLNQAYGIIECGLPFVNYRANEKNGTSVGRHLPKYEVRLALQDENDTAGEILLKGDGFFDAYFNPWQTQDQILSSGGWFHTGDLGRFAPGGYLNIVGRKKSAINFLGLKIFPEKIEDIINSHPSVEESRVVGKKHPDFGEIPAAEIIPAEDKEIDEIELTKHCAAYLAKHEIPQVFEPVKEIPKTRSGKVSRR